jgi:hypothetical protein
VTGAETEVVDVGATTAVGVVDIGALVVEVVGVEVAVVVVVDEEQDAKTIDITIRQVRAIQITPLFILPPILFGNKTQINNNLPLITLPVNKRYCLGG